MATDTIKITIACSRCGRVRNVKPKLDGGPKLPPGWRKVGEEVLCNGQFGKDSCVAVRYYTRAVRVEIVGLPDGEERSAEEFRAALSAAARSSAEFGNWCLQRLYMADPAAHTDRADWPKTKDGKPKLPPLPEVKLYAPALFPGMSPATCAALSRMVTGWYRDRRFGLFSTLSRSVDNYRFGRLPIEIRASDWKIAEWNAGKGRGVVRGMSVGPGKSWAVKIYCDLYSRQRFSQLVSGDAVPLALKIVRGTKEPFPGSDKRRKAWFVRVSAMFPRSTRKRGKAARTLTLGYDPGHLLFGALDQGDDVFEFHGDDIRKIIRRGTSQDRRMQRDLACLRGLMPRRKHKRWSRDRELQTQRRRLKLDYQLRLAATALVQWCVRRGVDDVHFDQTDRGFVPHLPFRRLRDYIEQGLEAAGISLVFLGTEPADEADTTEVVA